jgi:hypothetical protein
MHGRSIANERGRAGAGGCARGAQSCRKAGPMMVDGTMANLESLARPCPRRRQSAPSLRPPPSKADVVPLSRGRRPTEKPGPSFWATSTYRGRSGRCALAATHDVGIMRTRRSGRLDGSSPIVIRGAFDKEKLGSVSSGIRPGACLGSCRWAYQRPPMRSPSGPSIHRISAKGTARMKPSSSNVTAKGSSLAVTRPVLARMNRVPMPRVTTWPSTEFNRSRFSRLALDTGRRPHGRRDCGERAGANEKNPSSNVPTYALRGYVAERSGRPWQSLAAVRGGTSRRRAPPRGYRSVAGPRGRNAHSFRLPVSSARRLLFGAAAHAKASWARG